MTSSVEGEGMKVTWVTLEENWVPIQKKKKKGDNDLLDYLSRPRREGEKEEEMY